LPATSLAVPFTLSVVLESILRIRRWMCFQPWRITRNADAPPRVTNNE
jgi:hypothetical protein